MSAGHTSRTTRPGHVLVVAKAPVAGVAKTRLAESLGDAAAADLAAAALLDTLTAVESVTTADRRMVAMTGELDDARRGAEIRRRLAGWPVVGQRGSTFAARLVNAHRDAAAAWGDDAVVVQIGMDTPQVTGDDLTRLGDAVSDGFDASEVTEVTGVTGATGATDAGRGSALCALGPALDGGWWGLATSRAGYADRLLDVPMSRDDTCRRTADALHAACRRVALVHWLRDVDTIEDAAAVAGEHPQLAFSRRFAELTSGLATNGAPPGGGAHTAAPGRVAEGVSR